MMMNLSKILRTVTATAIALFFAAADVFAVPSYPFPVEITQADGSTLTIRLYGDERFSYATTSDGYTIVDRMGTYYYAKLVGTELVSSGIKAHDPAQRTREELAFLKTVTSPRYDIAVAAAAQTRSVVPYTFGATPVDDNPEYRKMMVDHMTSGEEFHSLVILVDFPDRPFTVPSPEVEFSRLLNETGYSSNGATGSARDYYVQNSNGKFNPTFDVVGPYTMSQSVYSYADGNEIQFVTEACTLAETHGIDFSKYVDDGILRDVFIYYAGYNHAEAGGSYIHPARIAFLRGGYFGNFGGGKLIAAAFSSELKGARGANMASIGTFCHEFGHIIGWHDYYDSDYQENGQSFGLNYYSLMSQGNYLNDGRTPPALSAFERYMAGWCDLVEISEPGVYTLNPVYDDNGFLLKTDNNGEYFVLEYRNGLLDPWDQFLRNGDPEYIFGSGSGMMVYHVDQSNNYINGAGLPAMDLWLYNMVNAFNEHECLKIMMADNPTIDSRNRVHDLGKVFFPGTGNVTELLASYPPYLVGWDGYTIGFELYDIKENGRDNITFELREVARGIVKNLEIIPSQTNVTVSFVSPYQDIYHLEIVDAAGKVVGEVDTYDRTINFSGLLPDTTYTIYIYYEGEDEPLVAEQVTTLSVDHSKLPTIEINNSYKPEDNIVLKLINYNDTIKSIEWSVNDKVQEQTVVKLSAGMSYKIMAHVVNSAGEDEYFIKYINVVK